MRYYNIKGLRINLKNINTYGKAGHKRIRIKFSDNAEPTTIKFGNNNTRDEALCKLDKAVNLVEESEE